MFNNVWNRTKKIILRILDFLFYWLNPLRIIYYMFFNFDNKYFILSVLLIRMFFIDYTLVPSCSMYPTMFTGDITLTSKISFGYNKRTLYFGGFLPFFDKGIEFKKIQYGDIVAFNLPHDNWTVYSKRIVALPNDKIYKKNGRTYVNDIAFKYELLREDLWLNDSGLYVKGWIYKVTMPNNFTYNIFRDKLLKELDNSQEDDDEDDETTNEYIVPENHYFMQGDNNLYSADSFDTEFMGFVPRECIFSKPFFVVCSTNSRLKESEKWIDYFAELFYRIPHGIYTINKDRFFKFIK